MKYSINTKITNEKEYVEKRLKDCRYWLKKYPHSRKWNKRLLKYQKYKEDLIKQNRIKKIRSFINFKYLKTKKLI